MNYVNYDKSIVQKYRVKIVRWPENVKFTNPASLASMDELRQLRQALRTHDCHWVKITEREVRLHMESIKEREAGSESVGRKRKQRSDKGKPRKKRVVRQPDDEECADEEENGSGVDDGGEENESTPSVPSRMQTRSKTGHRTSCIFERRRSVIIASDEESLLSGSEFNDN